MAEYCEAQEVTLRKTKALAPPFHQHIARSRMRERIWRAGDKVVVYEVVATRPEGPVRVTDSTVLRFE